MGEAGEPGYGDPYLHGGADRPVVACRRGEDSPAIRHRTRRAAVTNATLIRLRFVGGPLEGQEHASQAAAEVYRLARGEYHVRAADDGGAAVYDWHPDTPGRWHDPAAEVSFPQDSGYP